MKGPLPATILISPNGQRDRIDNTASIEFILSKDKRVRVGVSPGTGELIIIEFSDDDIITTSIQP